MLRYSYPGDGCVSKGVGLSDRYLFVGLLSAAACACASAVLALAHYGVSTDDVALAPERHETLEYSEHPAPAPADRMAYLPSDTLPNVAALPADEPDISTPWSIQTRREATTPAKARQNPAKAAPAAPLAATEPPKTYTVEERLGEFATAANKRLAEKFIAAEAAWPPVDIAFVAIKDEKVLEMFARPSGGEWKFIHRYPVLAASGAAGPKLRQGDKQVPEGVYAISFLNPNSRYHVSLRVNYPNTFDRQMAVRDGRKDLGGDIMIHGKTKSVGCLAIGDESAEELFTLAAQVGLPNIKLIIAPTDFRQNELPAASPEQPAWLPQLYTEVATAMSEFKAPPSKGLLSFFGN
jgi:hypothetical protein